MLCDNCKERDAVINLTQVEHDTKVTLHLCEQCAQQKGVETGAYTPRQMIVDHFTLEQRARAYLDIAGKYVSPAE